MARDGERGRGDWKARLGSPNSGPYAEASGASGDTGPVDIAAVRRDDALIDAIAGDGPVATDSAEEYQLASLLANWRADIVETPMPAGPDLDAVVAAVNQEIGAREARVNANRRGRLRLVRPLMGAAAAVAVIAGGTTAFSYGAQPGDPLWRVKEVVFSQQAQTTIAQRADDDMSKAQTLIDQGHPEQAKALLESASTNTTQVDDHGRKQDLQVRWQHLLDQLRTKAPEVASALESLEPKPSATPTTPPVVAPSIPGRTVEPGRQETTGSKPSTPGPEIMRSQTAPGTNENGSGPGIPGSETGAKPPTQQQQPPTTAEPPITAPPTQQQPPSEDLPTHEQPPTIQPTAAPPTTVGGGPVVPPTHQQQQTIAPPVYPTGPAVPTVAPPAGGGMLPGGIK
ncbi:anti-sigma-D factor RsdA [Nocardia spumae]|uniref:anti-sigma-D factor RsdA n=1 Tax=Nocardia spumae TaxID=2887190 RepID=UPI001D1581A1|nr:anti-sigma-D factor RsdA [Nocardia spumae]